MSTRHPECARVGCDSTVPVCRCGLVWSHGVYEDGVLVDYTSAGVVARYVALYGGPSAFTYVALYGGT